MISFFASPPPSTPPPPPSLHLYFVVFLKPLTLWLLRRWRRRALHLAENRHVSRFILACIVINATFLAAEHSEESRVFSQTGRVLNDTFAAIFAAEVACKMFGMGLVPFLANGLQAFDLLLVLASFADFCANSGHLSILRLFRLLRVIRLVRYPKKKNCTLLWSD